MKALAILFTCLFVVSMQGQTLKLSNKITPWDDGELTYTPITRDVILIKGKNGAKLCRNNGQFISDSIYWKVDTKASDGLIRAAKKRGTALVYGFLDEQGREFIPFEYDKADPFAYGHAVVQKGIQVSILDTLGKSQALPGSYYSVLNVGPGTLLATPEGRCFGLLRYDGSVLVPLIYGEMTQIPNDTFFLAKMGYCTLGLPVTELRKQALFDLHGHTILPLDNHIIQVHPDHIVVLQPLDSSAPDEYYDRQGKKIKARPNSGDYNTPLPKYLQRKQFANGALYGLLDSMTLAPLTPVVFDYLQKSRFGWLKFSKNQYAGAPIVGYMRFNGVIALERRSANNEPLSANDLLFYSNDRKGPWRWYDGKGREIFPDLIKKMEPYLYYNKIIAPADTSGFEVLGVSLKGDKLGLYDRSGAVIVPEKFDTLVYLSKRSLWFKEGANTGIINAKGEVVSSMPLKNITATGMFCPNGHPLLRTYENQRSGLMTEYGRELLPTTYKIIDSKPFYWGNRLFLWAISEKALEVYEVLADPPGSKPKK